jgi:transcriptional repressor of cell division inhibition gene dicB
MSNITKQEAIAMLGGSIKSAAKAIGCTVQAVYKWPDVLPTRIADRVIAARTRLRTPSKRKAQTEGA